MRRGLVPSEEIEEEVEEEDMVVMWLGLPDLEELVVRGLWELKVVGTKRRVDEV